MTHTVAIPHTTASPPPSDLAIHARGLDKTFGTVWAVDGVDVTIERGEVVALLGPNGAGKTTLIDMLLGFTQPSAGELTVLGLPPQAAVSAGRVGAVLQTGALLSDLTVKETVQMVAACHYSPIPTATALERAGITHLARRKVGKCSGGEQQRLRFALAMLTEPELLFLDEPTAGMDVRARSEFWGAIHEEAEHGRTVVFATHYLQEATEFADRIVLLRSGHVEVEGSVGQLTQNRSRTLTCRWTSSQSPADLAAAHEATVTETDGGRVQFSAIDTDGMARDILANNLAHTLEIHAASLDDIFMDLTEGTPAS